MKTISWWRLARFSVFLLGISSLVAGAQAATYYVSPSGSDASSGTLTAPFATLQKAVNLANPGDTIYMRGGTYTLAAQVDISRSGSSGNYISVSNYPGEVPILDAVNDNRAGAAAIRMGSASWWHFKGLELRNGYAYGLYLADTSSNNIVEFCNIHNNTRVQLNGAGIVVQAGSNNLLLNNDSHHNGVYGTSGGDGIDVNSQGTGNVVRGNRVWRNNDDGIDLWASQHVLVEDNWSWENGLKDNLTPSGGDGNGFKLGGGGNDGYHTIRNNLAWRNYATGFTNNSAAYTMDVFNNTAWNNNYQFSFYGNVAYVLKNNLSYPKTNNYINDASIVQDHNAWNLGVPVSDADFRSVDNSGATAARNADGTLPAFYFLNLAAGSDLIDAGVNVGIAYVGSAPDLGAYEYAAIPPPTGLRIDSTLP